MRERTFYDAPDEIRCRAIITLSDKSTAQCGRRCYRSGFCAQHAKMLKAGKPLRMVRPATAAPSSEDA